jgi:hypothetical protein
MNIISDSDSKEQIFGIPKYFVVHSNKNTQKINYNNTHKKIIQMKIVKN